MYQHKYTANFLRFYGDPDPGSNPNHGYGNDGLGGLPPVTPPSPGGNPPSQTPVPAAPSAPKVISFDEHQAIIKATQEKSAAAERSFAQKMAEIQRQLQGSESERNKAMEELKKFRESQMTAEEIAAQKIREREESLATDIEKYKGAASEWENRFKSTQVRAQITAAAAEAEAYNPAQIYMILSSTAKLVEKFNDEAKPTGEFEVMIPTMTKNGVVDMPIKNHLEALKKDEAFGNLFKGTGTGGFGTRPHSKSKPGNVLDGSVEDMMKEFQKFDSGGF